MATSVKRRRKEQTEYFFDYSLLFVVLFLLGFGLIMIYSASSYCATEDFGDPAHYLKKQRCPYTFQPQFLRCMYLCRFFSRMKAFF